MNVLNFGGGEIWEAIRYELMGRYPHATYLSVKRGDLIDEVGSDHEIRFDVSYPNNVRAAYALMPYPDLVIYTAGESHIQRFGEMDMVKVYNEFHSNVVGAFTVANEGVKSGSQMPPIFIFLVSVAGLYGKPNHAGYSASKMALRSLVQSLAMEGHQAYGISPGRVDTAMRRKDYPNDEPGTCLDTFQVAKVVLEILDCKHKPGDNVIIRKRGQRVLRRRDRNGMWKKYLNVQPL